MNHFDFRSVDDVQWSINEQRMLKYMLENDGLQFMRYFFKKREGSKLIKNWHMYVIQYVLDQVMQMKTNRLIINIAPGYLKTEIAVINFIARGLALYPRAKFIHSSYSGELALDNSSKIKQTILTPDFQELWPMKIRVDKNAKKTWFTEQGGGMVAVPSGGQITGFRAGRMSKEFTGAFVLDDPLKPDAAYSDALRMGINNRFNNTMRSRLGDEKVPFIIIMQRLHDDDLTGFLLRGGSGDVWHHLRIPTLFNEEVMQEQYPKDYTHGIPIDINLVLNALRGGDHYDFQH